MEPSQSRHERDFFRIVKAATAIGFAGVAGSLAALRSGAAGFNFTFSAGVVVAALAGAVLGWAYWQMVARWSRGRDTKPGPKLWATSVVLCLLGLAAFLYPIRFVAKENVNDVLVGLIGAFLVLGLVGVILWKLSRVLNDE